MKERIAARAPGVLLDARGTFTLFSTSASCFPKIDSDFGPMLSLDQEILPRFKSRDKLFEWKSEAAVKSHWNKPATPGVTDHFIFAVLREHEPIKTNAI